MNQLKSIWLCFSKAIKVILFDLAMSNFHNANNQELQLTMNTSSSVELEQQIIMKQKQRREIQDAYVKTVTKSDRLRRRAIKQAQNQTANQISKLKADLEQRTEELNQQFKKKAKYQESKYWDNLRELDKQIQGLKKWKAIDQRGISNLKNYVYKTPIKKSRSATEQKYQIIKNESAKIFQQKRVNRNAKPSTSVSFLMKDNSNFQQMKKEFDRYHRQEQSFLKKLLQQRPKMPNIDDF